MPTTNVRGGQVLDGSIQRADLDITTVGASVITKLIQGINVTLSSTGADAGTGDVTINASGGGTATDYVIGGYVNDSVLTDALGNAITSA